MLFIVFFLQDDQQIVTRSAVDFCPMGRSEVDPEGAEPMENVDADTDLQRMEESQSAPDTREQEEEVRHYPICL